jgi:hypothetical protein
MTKSDEKPRHHPGAGTRWLATGGVTGDHFHFRHPTKPGLVTVPHPVRDVAPGTLRSIERQSGLRLRPRP